MTTTLSAPIDPDTAPAAGVVAPRSGSDDTLPPLRERLTRPGATPAVRRSASPTDAYGGLAVTRHGAVAEVQLAPDVVPEAGVRLAEAVHALGGEHVELVLVDASRVQRFEHAPARALLHAHWRLASHGGRVRVVDPTPAARRTLRWVGADELLG